MCLWFGADQPIEGFLKQLLQSSVLRNALFIVANTLAGSGLGFIFWFIVTRKLLESEVGVTAALISALALIGNLSEMGLGITTLRFLSTLKEPSKFLNTAATAVAVCAFLFATVFLLGTPLWAKELVLFHQSYASLAIFIFSAIFFSVTQFWDRSFTALQVTHYAFYRVLIFNIARLLMVGLIPALQPWSVIAAIGVAALLSWLTALFWFTPKALVGYQLRSGWHWPTLFETARYSFGNHLSQLFWFSVPLIYPFVVLSLFGSETNAFFYAAWMLANVLFIIPVATSSAAFANVASTLTATLDPYWKVLKRTLLGLLPIVAVFLLAAHFMLSLFGQRYAENATLLLRLLGLSVLPYTLNTFWLTAYRIQKRTRTLVLMSLGLSLFIFACVYVGAKQGGLVGVGVGWLVGQSLACLVWILQRPRANLNVMNLQKPKV